MRRQIRRFVVVGILAVAVDFTVYYTLVNFLPHYIARTIAYVFGSTTSYVFNKWYTFEQKRRSFREMARFYLLYLGTLSATVLTNGFLLSSVFPGKIIVAYALSTFLGIVLNFLGQKFFVFRSNNTSGTRNMFFRLIKNSNFLQNIVVNFLSLLHPSIMHNLDKIEMIKKALWHCEIEKIDGGYFEFGTYQGTSLLAAVKICKKINLGMNRNFYGFDDFDRGFKYFDEKDRHPFFKEGDFVSSFEKAKKRFRNYDNVHLINGYFEDTVADKKPEDICKSDKCAVVFIDCDLMNPAYIALNFIRPILQPGSIIIIDDYFSYRGNEKLGPSGAFSKFLSENKNVKVREYCSYGYGGKSFIVSSVSS